MGAPKLKRRRMSMKRTRKILAKRQKEKKVRKRKMVRVKKKKRGMTKLYYGHPTSSFRTTYTKYATSSSSLLSKSKKRSTATVRKKKHASTNARNARPILSLHDRTSVIKKNKIQDVDGVF